jgi:type IV pilus assembly protein PilC
VVSTADALLAYGWIAPLVLVAAALILRQMRRSPATACAIDRRLLRLPLIGDWLRNIVVLNFMEVFGNLLESGFKVVEALQLAREAVTNAAIARCVADLESAVLRGERFSREIDNLGELFPPVVSQLIVVGERTGSLGKATVAIRQHLRREIERQTKLMVGVLEPTLTIGLAVMIGTILMAIYLPMFDMIGAVNAH